jgi:hypothetical protein
MAMAGLNKGIPSSWMIQNSEKNTMCHKYVYSLEGLIIPNEYKR